MTKKSNIRLGFSREFTSEVRRLKRKYRQIGNDLETINQQLKNGETPGDRMQEFAPYVVYKARVSNRDAQRGKSGGYRVIYYIRTAESIILLFIYTKTEQDDVSTEFLREVLKDYESEAPAPEDSAEE
jgi:mRNA-degrading endonuclease RelE of RelBE toxin-antitoxin system